MKIILLLRYDSESEDSNGRVEMYKFDSLTEVTKVKEWDLDCSPANAVFASNGKHFALSCFKGVIYMGVMDTVNEENISLTKVRNYNMTMRAMYFYNNGTSDVLFAFPAIYQYSSIDDKYLEDTKSYLPSDSSVSKEVPNGIPDAFEDDDSLKEKSQVDTLISLSLIM